MNTYFSASNVTPEEKENILSQHRTLYNGYRTMQSTVSNEQPLYVQDFAKDKDGMVVNNKGEVKKYTNFGINESKETKEVCDECGSMMMEGECTECGWKGEVGDMDEQENEDQEPSFFDRVKDNVQQAGEFILANPELLALEHEEDGDPQYSRIDDPHSPKSHRRSGRFKRHQYGESMEECKECGGMMYEGECSECGYKGNMDEETGHLDDIYHEEDLNPSSEFDYVKGASNKTNAFHVKEQAEDYINYDDNEDDDYEDPDNEDDGFEDLNTAEMDEQGGNAPDFDISNVDSAYNFQSDGPNSGYPVYEEIDEECDECWDKMESAFADEVDEQDVSGAQGIYGAMDPAFDFDSEGPGKAGPYQHSQYNENKQEDEDAYWTKDLDDDELDLDFEKFNPRDKSWEEITAHTGEDEFSHLDEDIKESVVNQKNKIMEMMNRMKVFK
jgi:hypothetical protein